MASIVQQQPSAGSEESAARRFWRSKMQKHPNLAGTLAIAGEVAGFFLNGHFIVALARWMIRVGGYVAESALLFAVLWISATSVAPDLIELVMSAKTMQYFVSVALIVLALIPEIILGNAIINAVGHWLLVERSRYNIMAWVWALAFTIPTVLFLYLTAYTLNTLAANGGNFVKAGAGMIGLRCFAGWAYGLLEMVYAGVGRRMVSQAQAVITPVQPAPAAAPSVPVQIDYEEIARQLMPLVAQEVRQIVPDTTGMVEQLHQLRADLEALTRQSAQQMEASESNTDVNSDVHIVDIEEYRNEQQPAQQPRAKVTRKLSTRTPKEPKEGATKSAPNMKQKALKVLQRNPDLEPVELARKAGISRQYASKILAERA